MKKSGAKVVINQDFPKGQPHRIKYTGMKFFRSQIKLIQVAGTPGVDYFLLFILENN